MTKRISRVVARLICRYCDSFDTRHWHLCAMIETCLENELVVFLSDLFFYESRLFTFIKDFKRALEQLKTKHKPLIMDLYSKKLSHTKAFDTLKRIFHCHQTLVLVFHRGIKADP